MLEEVSIDAGCVFDSTARLGLSFVGLFEVVVVGFILLWCGVCYVLDHRCEGCLLGDGGAVGAWFGGGRGTVTFGFERYAAGLLELGEAGFVARVGVALVAWEVFFAEDDVVAVTYCVNVDIVCFWEVEMLRYAWAEEDLCARFVWVFAVFCVVDSHFADFHVTAIFRRVAVDVVPRFPDVLRHFHQPRLRSVF